VRLVDFHQDIILVGCFGTTVEADRGDLLSESPEVHIDDAMLRDYRDYRRRRWLIESITGTA
jgi:hypothetical protein